MANTAFFARHGLNVQNHFQVNTTQLVFGTNVVITNSNILIGNSTVNIFSNSTFFRVGSSTANLQYNGLLTVANSSSTANLEPTQLAIGGMTLNSIALATGNTLLTTSGVNFGNSTANVFANSTSVSVANIESNVSIIPTQVAVGANVFLGLAALSVGNSTANLLANSIVVSIANSTGRANLTATDLSLGVVIISSTGVFVGNSTVNTVANSSGFYINGVAVGLQAQDMSFGNTTANLYANSTLLRITNSTSTMNLTPARIFVGDNSTNAILINTTLTVQNSTTSATFTSAGASKFNGQAASFYTDIPARLGYTPVNSSSGSISFDLTIGRSLGVGTSASGVTGRGYFTENVYAFFSDRRLKTNIQKLESALWKLNQLSGYTFERNELAKSFGYQDVGKEVGVIAQEVQEVLPEAIHLAPFDQDEHGNSKSGERYLTVQMERLIPLIVEAIKELTKRVEWLEVMGTNLRS